MAAQIKAAEVGFLSIGTDIDLQIRDIFESQGHSVTLFAPVGAQPNATRAFAADKDAIIISESIGSNDLVDPILGGSHLLEYDKPIVNWEVFSWDDLAMVGTNTPLEFGITGRIGNPVEVEGDSTVEFQTEIYIRDPSHPLAAGFSEGPVEVYVSDYNVTYGIPTEEAIIVADADVGGNFATLFDYPAGAEMIDGFIAPGRRIGYYIGQNDPNGENPPQFSNFSEAGLQLIEAIMPTLFPTPGTAGDYNGDGIVNAADYTMWRDNVGTDNLLMNDEIGGTIGMAHYDQWVDNFGNAAGSAAAVPEPTSLVVLVLGLAGWVSRRRRVTLR